MLGLALVALLAFGALSAGAASAAEAPRWKVSGTYLGAEATKAFTATSTSEVVLNQGAPNSAITLTAPAGECSESGEIEGSAEGSPGTKKNVTLTCKKVKVFNKGKEQPKCFANSPGAEVGTITTNKLKSTLVWLNPTGGAAGELLEPQSPSTYWATVQILGEACAILNPGGLKITNAAVSEVLPSEEEEAVTGTLKLPATPILSYYSNEGRVKQTVSQLKFGAAASTLSGSFSHSLNSKEAFGASSAPTCSATGSQLRWKISGYFVCPGESRAFSAINTTPLTINGVGGKLIMPECTETGKLVGPVGAVAGSKTNVVLTCNGVYLEKDTSKKCAVKSPTQPNGTIVTEQLQSTISNGALTSESGIVVTIEITGELCSAAFTTKYGGYLKDAVEPLYEEVKGLSTNLSGATLSKGGSPITVTGTMSTSPLSGGLIGVFLG